MFPTLNSAVITGGIFNQYNTHPTTSLFQKDPFERLKEATAPNSFHNSGERRDPQKCHPNTRVAILHKIHSRVLGVDSQTMNKRIVWMYGPAGAGKSAIAQSISDACYDDHRILAAFFFSRFDGSRNHPMSLMATVAYQIAGWFPGETKRLMLDCIDRDPLIFTRSFQTQVVSLLVNPLKPLIDSKYFEDPSNCRRVVIIDGLDECHDHEGQLDIVNVLGTILLNHNIPLVFLIASRPEHDLMSAFNSFPLQRITTKLPSDNGYQSDRETGLFIRDKLGELKNQPSVQASYSLAMAK